MSLGSNLSPPSELTLRVELKGEPEQVVFLQHGLTIRRDDSNAVVIHHPDVEWIHAACNQLAG
jgi:hypothetical protein